MTSGLRFGTAATTTRGFNQEDFKKVANMIADILDGCCMNGERKVYLIKHVRM